MTKIIRQEGESNEELLLRLGNMREQQGWTWVQLAEKMNELTGQEYTESKWRKQYQTFVKMFEANQTDLVGEDYVDDIVFRTQELQKEKYKFFDQRNELNRILRGRSRQEELNEILISTLKELKLPEFNYRYVEREYNPNDLLVSLNDLHYGADFTNAWNTYNPEVCEARLQVYLDEIISKQKLLKSENCIIWCSGDEISGNIHRTIQVSNRENVIKQVINVSELIANFLSILSQYFKKVIFCSVSGNHSRLDTKENSPKDERLDDLVEWYLEARLQNVKNVKFNEYQKLDETLYFINIRGKNYAGCHGDYDEGIAKLLTLEKMIGKPIYAVLSGHLHHNRIDTSQNIVAIMAGSLQGMDDFCIQKRIFGNAEQLICCVTDKGLEGIFPVIFE